MCVRVCFACGSLCLNIQKVAGTILDCRVVLCAFVKNYDDHLCTSLYGLCGRGARGEARVLAAMYLLFGYTIG